MPIKTNAVSSKFNYQDKANTKKVNARMTAQKMNNANPDQSANTRRGAKVKQMTSSKDGMQGLSIGQRVPMNMFDQKYQKPSPTSMSKVTGANQIGAEVKKALKGKQKQFFGL